MISFTAIHHVMESKGGKSMTACGEPSIEFQNCEKSKFIEDTTCPECLAYWDERFKATFKEAAEKKIDDGPLPV